ncbi:MAG TPA: glycosyltransferase family 39 protein [Polyangia bacterium]|nr:glycosyltransferase family 39 protein [Polyangia bacterium]
MAREPKPVSAPDDDRRRHRRRSLLAAASIAVAAVLAFHGLDNHKLWDDEANTALFGRNLLATGELSAFDGTNLIGFRGGGELDENLRNVYMPPLQYWVAAAGFGLLGESTFTARVPFVLLGLASLALLAVFSRRLLGERFPWWLPVALTALSPAWLLYIRNCRYYAPGVFFVLVLLVAFTARGTRLRDQAFALVGIGGSVVALFLSNYFNAFAGMSALACLLALREFRSRGHLVRLAVALVVSGLMAAHVWFNLNPFETENIRADTTAPLERFFTLLGWQLAGLGTFEFFPVVLAPLVALPLVLRRLAGERPLAARAAVIAGAMLAAIVATAATSPQSVSGSMIADMRYLVPLIVLGAVVTAVVIVLLFRLWKPLAAAMFAIVCFSNLAHLGFLGDENGFLPPKSPQCTICRYVIENLEDWETSTEKLVGFLKSAPSGHEVLVIPGYMAYSPMFYRPDLHFCCQLEPDHPVRKDLKMALPAHIWWHRAAPDVGLVSRAPPRDASGPLWVRGQRMGNYRLAGSVDARPVDTSRPEIPWHAFSAEENARTHYVPYVVMDIRR